MAYSASEKAAAQGAQDWLNAGNQWMVDVMGWDWFFSAYPEYAPYRDAVMNRSAVLSEPAAPAPTPTPTPAPTSTPTNQDSNIGKVYQRVQDIPEGYSWAPTSGMGTPMTSKADIMAAIEAANRGEQSDYQKQFTYQITGKKPEGVLTQESPGIYTYVKDGKEYVYAPKEFVNYGAVGAEQGDLGKTLNINSLIKSKDLLDKATKTNIDPKEFQADFTNAGIKDPYQGYVWRKQDYIDGIYAQTGGKPTDYNYNPNDALSAGNKTIYPEQYGTYQGQDENGNYIYKKGKGTTVFDPVTAKGTTYWPGEDGGLGGLLPFVALAGLAFGIPAGLELLAGEAAGAGAIGGAGFGELTAAELADLGVTAETLGGGTTSLASAGWDPSWMSSVGQGAGDIAAGQAASTLSQLKNVYNLAKTGYNLVTSKDPLKVLMNSGISMGTSAITSEIPGFDTLSDAQKKAANSVIASTLSGQDPTQALVNSALNAGVAAVNITSQIPGYDTMTADQRKAVDSAISTTLRGGNPTQSLVDAAVNAGINAAKDPYTTLRDNGLLPQSTGNSDQDSGQTITPDDSSPSGYRDIIGNPVNYDGTPYVPGTASGTTENPTDTGKTELPPTENPPAEEPQCAPGYRWNGSMCVSEEDVTDTSTSCPEGYLFDTTTQSCVPVGTPAGGTTTGGTIGGTKPGTTTGGTTTGGTTTGGTTTGGTTTPGTSASSAGLDLASLLALMGGTGQQAQPTQPVIADMGEMVDIEDLVANPLQTDYRKLARKPTMAASGGSIDDLLALLNEKR